MNSLNSSQLHDALKIFLISSHFPFHIFTLHLILCFSHACCCLIIIIIIIMSLTPVSSSFEDIGGVPSMQSCYSAGMKRCGICLEERSPLWVRRSKSEETFCRLLITMVEETFDIRRSWVDHGRQIMNLKSGYVEGENSKWKVKQRKMICGPFLIGYQAQ